MDEHLKFLINQTEERIKLVDTKASIIVAFFALVLSSNSYFQNVVLTYNIPIWYCYLIILFLLFSFFFLILTIRPVKNWKILWDFKKNKKNETTNEVSFWIETEKQADNFDINNVSDLESNYQKLLIELSKRRILKYKNYRRSMWFLRIAIFSLVPCLIIIVIKSLYSLP